MTEKVIVTTPILNKHQQGELYFGVKNDGTVVGQEINDETQYGGKRYGSTWVNRK